jgi:hypothetical protein
VMRSPTILAALATVLVLTAQATPAGAQSSDSSNTPFYSQGYTLTVPAGGIPAVDVNATPTPPPQFIFDLNPTGAIVAPPNSSPPPVSLNPLSTLSDSSGFSPSYVDALKDDGSQFAISFASAVAAGDVLHTTLDINSSLQSNPPTFVSEAPAAGSNLPIISLVPDAAAPTSSQTSTTTSQATDTPEPLSVLLWSALTGVGLWYARRRRPVVAPALWS